MSRDLALILLNIINPIAIYLIYAAFLGQPKYNKKIVFAVYFVFNFITTFVLLKASSSILNSIFFLGGMILLTFLYEGKIYFKIFIAFIIYIIFALEEISLYLIFSSLDISLYNLDFEVDFVYVFIKISMLLIAFFINLNFNKFRNKTLPKYITIFLFIVPILSIIIMVLETVRNPISDRFYALLVLFLLLINISIFVIFTILSNLYTDRLRLNNLEKDYDLINMQKENINKSTKRLAALEHDLKNKLIPLYYMAESEGNVGAYLSEIIGEFKNEFLIANSGLIEVDAIINSKYEFCKENNIDFDVDLNISKDININHRDLAIILGNLLDNAIEASSKVADKWIRLVLKSEQNLVFIMVDNSFDGILKKKNGKLISRKNKEFSGLGLSNVEYLADKYGGKVTISHKENKFRVSVILFEKK
ncbi:sensor histidine kinase [Neofamilia massiliensis]|uniref:sensor histidine kinase n=1 Tax=Neofamilia massiliensis TaxID=1673724 RepID=UPI0006BB897F|nr:sensor histidine kinase [Neofamilia massiliensis]